MIKYIQLETTYIKGSIYFLAMFRPGLFQALYCFKKMLIWKKLHYKMNIYELFIKSMYKCEGCKLKKSHKIFHNYSDISNKS